MSQAGSSGANGGGAGLDIRTITGNTGGAESPLANNFDIVGTGSITVAGSAHTETVQLTGLTTHNVLVGAGSATITKVAPSATSGIPLVSGGSSADPSFTTAVVAGGGTGIVTTTAYAPICGGTTATGNFQAATTGFSTSGYVLTSAGSSALPSWQAVPLVPMTWTDEAISFGAVSNNGYFLTTGASLNATLPASPNQGDTISFVATSVGVVFGVIANTGQKIAIGAAKSASAGSAQVNIGGNMVTLVYRASDSTWYSTSVIGSWLVA